MRDSSAVGQSGSDLRASLFRAWTGAKTAMANIGLEMAEQWRRAKPVEVAIHELTAILSRFPTEKEVAQKMQVEVAAYRLILDELKGIEIGVYRFQSPDLSAEEELVDGTMQHEETHRWPSRRSEMRSKLAEAIELLPKEERLVLSLYYHEELTLKEIGIVLNKSESHVSQIRVSALLYLRSKLSDCD